MRDNSIFNVGLYLRLSREDENTIESESISHQRLLLEDYVKVNRFNLVDEYVDDGYTGTNFTRPDFNRLIRDIEAGKINCVITKDMSRLGRDYISTGWYLEKYFPEHNVRFISINDNIDTITGQLDDVAPFKAVINDYYAKDISNKVRTSITAMKKRGKFLGGIPPYGYKFASEKNHQQLVIDEVVAPVVRRMFQMYANGKSLYEIADTFNQEKIPIPSIYKNIKRKKSEAYGLWQTRTIDEILKNPTYIGNLTQGRRRKVNYKSKKIVRLPKEEWIVVENTHKPIIDKETFDKVQSIYEKNKNRKCTKNNVLFGGFLYCKECGHKIGINKTHEKYYCCCNYYKRFSKQGLCTPHSIPYDLLEKELLTEIRKECKKSVREEKFPELLKNNNKKKQAIDNITKLIAKKNLEIEQNNKAVDDLYIAKLKQELDNDRYKSIYNRLNEELNKLKNELHILKNDYNKLANEENESNQIADMTMIKEFLELKEPSRELMANLIDKIVIDEDKHISIYYKIRRYS